MVAVVTVVLALAAAVVLAGPRYDYGRAAGPGGIGSSPDGQYRAGTDPQIVAIGRSILFGHLLLAAAITFGVLAAIAAARGQAGAAPRSAQRTGTAAVFTGVAVVAATAVIAACVLGSCAVVLTLLFLQGP